MGDGYVLVLDVDETLLNIEPLFFLEKFKKNYKEYEGKLLFNKYYLSPRPGVHTFLEKARKSFTLVAFSVVSKKITMQKLKAVGVLHYFSRVYGEEDLQNGKKSLKKVADDLNTDLSHIKAIDDMPYAFIEQDDIIKIKPWFIGDSKDDTALLHILERDIAKIPS